MPQGCSRLTTTRPVSLLYFAVFAAVAWLWRPSDNNFRLAMSDELATDEDDVHDLEDLEGGKDSPNHLSRDEVVFDVGNSSPV